jgi:large subunit ribosomal protein L22
MRLVIDLIRGKSVPEALHILHFSPKHASKVAEKVLRSAVANLQNKDEGGAWNRKRSSSGAPPWTGG